MARWGQRQAGLVGERDELFDDVDAALVVEVFEVAGAAQVVLLAFADAAGEHPLPERAPYQGAEAVALCCRQYVVLDAAVEDRVRQLLCAEAFQPLPFGKPLGLDDGDGRCVGRSDRPHLAGADQVGERGERFLDVRVRVQRRRRRSPIWPESASARSTGISRSAPT